MVILGFIPSDERKFSYNFVFGLSLTIMKIAEKHGGRAYSTGLYFTSKAKDVLGKDRLTRLKSFKKKVDPKGILNPGKVLGGRLIGTAVRLGSIFEPLIRPFGNAIITKVGERPRTDVTGYPAPTWPGMPTAAPSAATAWTSATSSTAGDGRARARGASGTGCGST